MPKRKTTKTITPETNDSTSAATEAVAAAPIAPDLGEGAAASAETTAAVVDASAASEARAAGPTRIEPSVASPEIFLPAKTLPSGKAARSETGWRLVAAPAFLAVAVTFAAGAGAALSPLIGQAISPARAAEAPVAGELATAVGRLSVELAALRTSVEGATSEQSGGLAGIAQRLDRLEGWQSALAAKVAKLPEARDPTPQVSREITGAIAAARDSGVDGWVVRSAGNGRAIIEGRGNLFQVAPGSQIPGVGTVKDIVQQSGRWMVVTTAGVIAAPSPSRAQF